MDMLTLGADNTMRRYWIVRTEDDKACDEEIALLSDEADGTDEADGMTKQTE